MEARRARGFSLVEVLMSIFILGIGIISIAALFPAGIAQQRQSVDDILGPTIASNALSVLRTKLEQQDFGAFEDFGFSAGDTPRPTIPGDWSWLRPAFVFPNNEYVLGAIDIFNYNGIGNTSTANEFDSGTSVVRSGIPYNSFRYPNGPPAIVITQQERYYPQHSDYRDLRVAPLQPKPQYVWDCAFRRFQGRVLVAIFVYRVAYPGGEPGLYAVGRNDTNPSVPPLPIWRNLAVPNEHMAWDSWGLSTQYTNDDSFVYGSLCDQYDPFDAAQSWQEGGQWILGQNNNVHRVISASCDDPNTESRRVIELMRPAPAMPIWQTTGVGANYSGGPDYDGQTNIVTDIWYIPATASDADKKQVKLTPAYVLVEEL